MVSSQTLQGIAAVLRAGGEVSLEVADFPCFAHDGLAADAHVSPETLAAIAAGLSDRDACVFERAAQAAEAGETAWLGFKVVYDAAAAVANVDNEVTPKYGNAGSANAEQFPFFCNEAGEVVCGRAYSPRDEFQMLDVTRGPSMHTQQFDGLTWVAVPLSGTIRVWLLGATDASAEVAALASHVGFDVVAVDYDADYLSPERFGGVQRLLLAGGDFSELSKAKPSPADYACVLTRGHMFDPDACVWAASNHLRYIGMMGCKGKNDTVHDLVLSQGLTEEDWQRIKRPIGLKFGAKTPAELAIAIVAELVDERYKQRTSAEARARHEADLGR